MIIISAAGFSTRFRREGITTSKVLLPLRDGIVFDYVLASFKQYHGQEDFVVVTRDEDNLPEELRKSIERAQVKNYEIVTVESPQDGMLPNILKGLEQTNFSLDERLLIHVADIFRPDFTMPDITSQKLTIDFGLKASNTPPPEGLLRTVKNTQGLGCYALPSAAAFLASYKNAQLPGIRTAFGEKVMEIVEGVRLIKGLSNNGASPEPRLIPPEDYINCGKPKEYRQLRATDLFRPF